MGLQPIAMVPQPRRPATPDEVAAARLAVVREYYALYMGTSWADATALERMVSECLAGEAPTHNGQPLPNDTPFGIPEPGGLPAAQFPRPAMQEIGKPATPTYTYR